MRVLVIAAHPDDEVLGCGGTIARLAREGHEVRVAILGEGVTSRYPNREDADLKDVQALQEHARAIGSGLGAQEVTLHGLPDNRFDSLPLLEIVKTIEGLVGGFEPRMIFTHHGGDLNIDHALTFRATLTATRPLEGTTVEAIYAYEVASSTEWAFHRFSPVFQPNFFMDISATLELKIDAMRRYETEMREFPHPRSAEALRATAQRWGSVVGREAAEAFEIVRSVQ